MFKIARHLSLFSAEDLYTRMIIYLSYLLIKKDVSETRYKKIKTYILCSILFSFEYSAVCEVKWKYFRNGQATDDNIIRCVRFAC